MAENPKSGGTDKPIQPSELKHATSISSKKLIKRAIRLRISISRVMILKACSDEWNGAFRNSKSVKTLHHKIIQFEVLHSDRH